MRDATAIRLLLLDCDGVLVRSERANLAYYNHLFGAFGLPPVSATDRGAVGRLHTLSTPQVIEAFFAPEQRQRVSAYAETLEYAGFVDQLEAEPGWVEVLHRWRRKGRAAVATNRGASARVVLEAVGLLELVDHVVTIRDVVHPKPHPELLIRAMEHCGATPEETLYVGDSDLDREAAGRANVRFLGFGEKVSPAVSSPEGVERFLSGLAGGDAFATLHTVSSS